MSGITFLDVGILLLFLYFSAGGYHKGFIKQTSTIVGIVLAVLFAINFYRVFTPYIDSYFNVSAEMLQFISFTILFIAINIVINILGMVFKKMLNLLFLGPLDHAAGALLGLLKGGLLAYFMVLIMNQIPYQGLEAQLDSSFLASKLLNLTPIFEHNIQKIFGAG